MSGSSFNSYNSPEAMFERAVQLAHQGHRQPAYNLFKQVSQTQLGVWNPNIWLWVAKLTTDFNEGEAALHKAADLGPLHPDLVRARQDFAVRKRITLRHRRISFWGMLTSFGMLALLTVCIADFFPAVGNIPGIYILQFTTKGTLVCFSCLAIPICIIFTIYYLMNRAARNWWITPLLLLAIVGSIIMSGFGTLAATEYAEVYHNKIQINDNTYHLETAYYTWRLYKRREQQIRVYKCDASGLFCARHYTLNYNMENIDSTATIDPRQEFTLKYDANTGLQVQYIDVSAPPLQIPL